MKRQRDISFRHLGIGRILISKIFRKGEIHCKCFIYFTCSLISLFVNFIPRVKNIKGYLFPINGTRKGSYFWQNGTQKGKEPSHISAPLLLWAFCKVVHQLTEILFKINYNVKLVKCQVVTGLEFFAHA